MPGICTLGRDDGVTAVSPPVPCRSCGHEMNLHDGREPRDVCHRCHTRVLVLEAASLRTLVKDWQTRALVGEEHPIVVALRAELDAFQKKLPQVVSDVAVGAIEGVGAVLWDRLTNDLNRALEGSTIPIPTDRRPPEPPPAQEKVADDLRAGVERILKDHALTTLPLTRPAPLVSALQELLQTTERDDDGGDGYGYGEMIAEAQCAAMKEAARAWAKVDGHHCQPLDSAEPCTICAAFSGDAGVRLLKRVGAYRTMIADLMVAAANARDVLRMYETGSKVTGADLDVVAQLVGLKRTSELLDNTIRVAGRVLEGHIPMERS